jgi:hypothetical protein
MGWHLNDLTVAASAPKHGSLATGYMFDAQGTQHVIHRDGNRHIDELWWDGDWHHNDLTAAAGAPQTSISPAAYVFDAQATQHVFYQGWDDNHVHELWWDGDWHHNDLTSATNAPVPAFNVGAYVFEGQKTQHVIYRGWDDHVHELWWDGEWHYNDLTVAAGAPSGKVNDSNPPGDPVGYEFGAQGTQHVVYRAQNAHVHELWWDGKWHFNDLTVAASAPLAGHDGADGGEPAAYMFDAQGTQHVVYVGADKHIHELWWDGDWHHNDLTAAAGGQLAYGHLAGYVFAAQDTQHVFYQTTHGFIQELWWDGNGWHFSDISAAVGAPKSQTPPAAYTFDEQGTQHVLYQGSDNGHIYELWWEA